MISAIILTKNEQENIKDCINSLLFCGEIIVIDDNSTDETVELAKDFGAKVFVHKMDGNFAEQRNFGLSKAKGDWVFFVDADERVTPELSKEIINSTWIAKGKNKSEFPDGYFIKRQDFFWDKKLNFGETSKVKLLRLARRDAGKWTRRVHEIWNIKGEVKTLNNSLNHYPHQTLQEFVEDIDNYSTLHAQEKDEQGEGSNLIKIIFWPIFKFLQNFLLRLGFLDGVAGAIVALMMSFHSFLSWSKLYLMQKNTSRNR